MTQGSKTCSVGNLESIRESDSDTQSDTTSRSASEISMGHNESHDMHKGYPGDEAEKSRNPLESPGVELKLQC